MLFIVSLNSKTIEGRSRIGCSVNQNNVAALNKGATVLTFSMVQSSLGRFTRMKTPDSFLQKKSSSKVIEKELPKKSVQGSALFDYKWSMLECEKWNYVRKLFYLTCSYYFLVRI